MDQITLTTDGSLRQYALHIPGHGSGEQPLVLFLHGAGGTAAWADDETGWSRLAKRKGFVLALPEALPPDPTKPPKFLTNPARWNDGGRGMIGNPSTADDVRFLAAVINDIAACTPIDPRRVYLGGFSNGAGMTFRAAAELASRFAAVAPIAGYCRVNDPRPARPVPTFYMVGTIDPIIPLRGGEVRSPWQHRLVRRQAVAETLERWAVAIGCDPVPRVESDADGIRTEVYPGPVEFRSVVIDGLGHHWPGGKGMLNHKIAGPPSDKMDATIAVWEFFRRHTG